MQPPHIATRAVRVNNSSGKLFEFLVPQFLAQIDRSNKDVVNAVTDVVGAKITVTSYYIGFIPGLLATFLGSAASCIGIFKRQTAQLFKELEA